MFEKFTSKDAGDFRQRYLGTFGYFRKGNNKTLVRLDRIHIEGNRSVEFTDMDGLKYILNADANDDTTGFDFLPPKVAYHNTNTGAYLLRRIPARQFLRGICDRNTQIVTVGGIPLPIDFRILKELFEKPISVKEALANLQKIKAGAKERSVALSSQFAISVDTESLYCFGNVIGNATLNKDSFIIKLNDYNLWSTEIRDALNRAGLTGEIS